MYIFQSTPSAWRETENDPPFLRMILISIHSLRMEGDSTRIAGVKIISNISIHSLRMEGDILQVANTTTKNYFNPLPPHGGRRRSGCINRLRRHISIHSLRMEGDRFSIKSGIPHKHFNPLPPHGGRQASYGRQKGKKSFQSTPSAWRETLHSDISRR